MSTPTTVQSNLVPVAISTDSGVTYKNVVCKKAWNFNGNTPTNVDDTDCGPLVGLGSNNWTIDMDMVLNNTPNTGEISAKEVLAIWAAQSLAAIKVLYPDPGGTAFFIQGSGYITSFVLQNTVGNNMTFTATFTGQGSPDVTV